MSWQLKSNIISKKKPNSKFINKEHIIEIAMHIIICVACSAAILHFIHKTKTYSKTEMDSEGKSMNEPNTDNSSLFLIGCFEIVITALVFNIESTYRMILFKNAAMLVWAALCLSMMTFILFFMKQKLSVFLQVS